MSEAVRSSAPWEPERYELVSAPVYRFDLDRRDFFKFLGAGVLVFSVLKQTAWSQESGGARARRETRCPGRLTPGCTLERTAKSRCTQERWKWVRTSAPR